MQSSPCTDLREPSKTSWSSSLKSPWKMAWLMEHCSNLLLLFHQGEPHDDHATHLRLKGKPWRVEMPSFDECVDCRKRTRHKLEATWSRGVSVGVRIVMDETGTYVVQSVRRVPEEQRYDHGLLQCVRGTPWEPNPGDASTDLPEPMLSSHNCQTLDLVQSGAMSHGGMPSLRSSPRRIANVCAWTHCRVQEAT